MAGIGGQRTPRIETSGTPSNVGCVSSGSPRRSMGTRLLRLLEPFSPFDSTIGSNTTAAISTPQPLIGVNRRTSRRWTSKGPPPARPAPGMHTRSIGGNVPYPCAEADYS